MTNFSSLRPRRLGPLLTLLLTGAATTAQAQLLAIQGTGGSNPAGNDVTAFVDKVEIVRVSDGAVMASALANASFETSNALGNGAYGYNPTGGSWTFANTTGIETTGSNFGAPTNPDGTRGAFIQNTPSSATATNAISQALSLAAGTYQVRFQAAQRGCCSGVYDQGLRVLVGGVQIGAVTPPSNTSFTSYTSSPFTVTATGTVATNNALAFDGQDDYVALPNTTPVPTGNSTYTLEAWIKPTAMGIEGIIGWGNWGVTNQVNALRLSPDGIINYWWGPDLIVTTADLSGHWHHVAVTFNGTTRTIYLDGAAVGSDTPGSHTVPTPTNLRIGSTNNGEYFNGSIDEVRVYSTGLTAAQVQADMYSTAAAVPASLVAYFTMDQGTAGGTNTGQNSLADQSGKGSTGTLTNFGLSGSSSNFVRSFPTITAIAPASGPTGTSVQVTGTNLNDATSFGFNGAAGSASIANDFAATLTVPTTATTGPVSVASATLAKYNGPLYTLASTNNALAFDGSNDYVAFPSTTTAVNNLGTSAYTLEAWVYYTGASNVNSLIRKSGDYNLYINYGRLGAEAWQLGSGNAAMTNITGSATLPTNQWTHVAATWNKATGSLKLYVNGVLDASATMGSTNAGGVENLNIGYSTAYTGQDLGGKLDEVRIYSTALTAANIQADMFSTAASVPASLGLYLNFDQGTAGGTNTGLTTLTDQSANGYVGTLLNFALTGTTSNWVRSFPTITGITPTNGAVGTSVSFTGTNLLDAASFAFNGTNAASVAISNDLSATVTVPNSATTGLVSLASAALAKYSGPLFTLAYPDLVISTPGYVIPTGIYNNITVASGGVGIPNGDVTVNTALVVQNGGTLFDGCSLFVGSGSFTLQAGGTLNICRPRGILSGPNTALGNLGAVRVLGTRSFSPDASYVYSGGQSQDTGDGLPSQVRNFTVSTSTDLSLTSPLAIAQVLTLSGAGNLTTAGNALTLLSNSAGTALVVNSGTGTVVGAATVQRYIDPSQNPGAGYRHYAAPVSNTTVADLVTSGFTPVVNPAYNSSATPAMVTPFPTVYGYDQALVNRTNASPSFDKGFFSPTSLADALVPGRGYAVNIGASQLVDFTGTLNNGDLGVSVSRNATGTLNAPDAGWQFLGNPYPAPLDYSRVAAADRAGLEDALYVYGSTGQYVGQYRAFVNGLGSGNPVLPIGQGFFVRAMNAGTSGTFTFRNSQRLTTPTTTTFQRLTADLRPQVQLELRGSTGPADAFIAYAETGATTAFDSQYDAAKLPNPDGLNLAGTATSGEPVAIDGRPAFLPTTVLPLTVGVPAAGTYVLSAAALANLPTGLDAFLADDLTGQTLKLTAGATYSFGVTAAQAVASITGRFHLYFRPATALATVPSLTADVVSVYPNPAHAQFTVAMPGLAQATTVQADLLNTLGQSVRRQAAALPPAGTQFSLETTGLAAGVYTLRLQAGATTLAKRVVIQ